MITRRKFVASAAAGTALAAAAPALAFEVDPKFRPQQVGIKNTLSAGQILILPLQSEVYFRRLFVQLRLHQSIVPTPS